MALNKFGSVHKIAAAVLEPKVTLEVEQIIESKKANAVYFRARAISAGDQGPEGVKWNFNGNLDYFSKKELLKAYKTFCGRSLFLNHDTSSPLKAVGKVLDSYPVEDPDTHEFYIECLARVDKALHPELAGMIENGDLNSVSMGASCGASQCSICAHTIHSDQDSKCAHLNRLGQQFDAEVDLPEYSIKKGESTPAFCINSDLTFSELSIVSVPADSAALIKTVIAAFSSRLKKTAAHNSSTSIVAELDTLLGLLSPADREAVKAQICTSVGSCKVAGSFCTQCGKSSAGLDCDFCKGAICGDCYTLLDDPTDMDKPDEVYHSNCPPKKANQNKGTTKMAKENLNKVADLLKEAAAYDVLVYALDLAGEDKALAAMDLVKAMEHAGFTTGRSQEGKAPERQVFYTALHAAIANGWVTQVETGLYQLSTEGKARAKDLKKWLGEGEWASEEWKGKLGPEDKDEKKDKKAPKDKEEKTPEMSPEEAGKELMEKPADAPETPAAEAPMEAPTEEAAPAISAPMEEAAPEEGKAPLWPAGKKTNLPVQSAVETILSKLSGLEYERLQEHMSTKIKAKDTSMAPLKPEVAKTAADLVDLKPNEEGLPDMKPSDSKEEKATELPAPGGKAHEEKEVKEEKDEVQKLDEAAKLIKEVKKEIKEQMGDDMAVAEGKPEEAPKEEPMPEGMPMAPASVHPKLTAKFNKKPFLSQSSWSVFDGDQVILTAVLRDICGEHLSEMKALVTSKEYGDRLIARINSDGLDKIAALLGTQPIKVEAKREDASAEIKTSYDGGEHLVANTEGAVEKKAGACPCGKAECPCDCMLGKECSCKMAMASATPEVTKEAAKESPATLSEAEKPSCEPAGPSKGQDWDKGKNMFSNNKTESDEAKAKEIGTEDKAASPKKAKLEKGEQTLAEAEKPAAHPAGGARNDLMEPVPEAKATKEIGKESKLESGEMTLDKAEKPAAPDAFKPKMGTESSVLSDEAKAKEIGTEDKAATQKKAEMEAEVAGKLAAAEARYQQLEAALAQEKMERSLEAKMVKCRKLVEEMFKKDLLAESSDLVEKYVKQGENLLDARKSAIKETVDLQLAAFMQMPDSLLKVQAETIARIKRTSAPISDKLRIPIQGQFNPDSGDADWLQSLPWS